MVEASKGVTERMQKDFLGKDDLNSFQFVLFVIAIMTARVQRKLFVCLFVKIRVI